MALAHEQARTALEAAVAKAAEMKIDVSIAVVDVRGFPVALTRMDGAGGVTSEIAIGKAKVAAMFGRPSGERPAPIADALNGMNGWRLVFWQGAVPLQLDGELAGAIGASGSSSENDEVAAQAGADAL